MSDQKHRTHPDEKLQSLSAIDIPTHKLAVPPPKPLIEEIWIKLRSRMLMVQRMFIQQSFVRQQSVECGRDNADPPIPMGSIDTNTAVHGIVCRNKQTSL